MTEREQLEQAIAALEAQRAILGESVAETALAPLRQKLAALNAQPAEPQRKLITVLFADISGFTAMSETMDAEDVTDTMNALWTRLDAAIKMHGGEIDKHIGDAVMALFGAQAAAEDDPEQAIRAALAMQSELAAFRDAKRVALAMRIGVNTGPVLYGQVGTVGEVTAMGDTVNLASRLEHAAPVGGILISHDTFRHVRGVFDVQPLDPISVKGKSEPVRVYVVQRARQRAFRVATRGVEGVETRMIGRDAEFKRLQDAYRMAVGENKTQIVTVVGDAGVGKSRLLYEFDQWLDLLPERIRYFKGRALSETSGLPYALIRSLLAFRLEILESDSAAEVQAKLERGIGEFLPENSLEKAYHIGYLVGFGLMDSPYAQSANARVARHYLTQFFTAMTASQPAVLFLEDVHWADLPSLDFVNHLAKELPNRRLLVVCLARPTLFERLPEWGEGQTGFIRLDLHSLAEGDSRLLVQEVLQKVDNLPDTLRELVVSSADGNPFYVEELVKMLVEDGVIVKGAEQWRVERPRLADLRVPPTLTGVLQARLDSLSPIERAILQRAAVVGRIFWDAALAHLRAETDTLISEAQPTLAALCGRELVFPRETSTFASAEEYIFKHALLRDVTYETVLKRLRRVYHRQVADWLVGISGERVKEYSGVIGEHYALASDPDKAVEYLLQAAKHALSISSFRENLALSERALDLMAADNTIRVTVLNLMGKAHEGLSEYPEAKLRYGEGLALGRAAGDRGGEAVALHGLGYVMAQQANYSAAEAYYQESLAISRAISDHKSAANSLNNLGIIAHDQGQYELALGYYEEALTIMREIGDDFGIGIGLGNLGGIATSRGEYETARAYFEKTLAIFRNIGDRRRVATVLDNLGAIANHQRRYDLARTYQEESLAIFRDVGDRQGMAYVLLNRGGNSFEQGQYTEAQAAFEEGLVILRDIGDRWAAGYSLQCLARVLLKLGEVERARVCLHEALDTARAIGAQSLELATLSSIARLRAAEKQPEQAVMLVAFVDQHPATEQANRNEDVSLLAELRASLPATVFAAALERGKTLDLGTVVEQILVG